jgi:hypothetical protein
VSASDKRLTECKHCFSGQHCSSKCIIRTGHTSTAVLGIYLYCSFAAFSNCPLKWHQINAVVNSAGCALVHCVLVICACARAHPRGGLCCCCCRAHAHTHTHATVHRPHRSRNIEIYINIFYCAHSYYRTRR